MGQWGSFSCDGDSCWDALCDVDFENPTPQALAKAANDALEAINKANQNKEFHGNMTGLKQDFLGVLIWGVQHGVMDDAKLAKIGVQFAVDLLNDEDYLAIWDNPTLRVKYLQTEKLVLNKIATETPIDLSIFDMGSSVMDEIAKESAGVARGGWLSAEDNNFIIVAGSRKDPNPTRIFWDDLVRETLSNEDTQNLHGWYEKLKKFTDQISKEILDRS